MITITRWLSVLEASNIIYLLKPFYANSNKRLSKTPKLYFLNSGLAAKLCGLTSAKEVEQSVWAGTLFESFVIAEIMKSHLNSTGSLPDIYFYRDSNRNEIDLIIRKGQTAFAVVRRMCGKKWSVRPNMVHWLYTGAIEPSIFHDALVWWPKVIQKTTKIQLGRIQRNDLSSYYKGYEIDPLLQQWRCL